VACVSLDARLRQAPLLFDNRYPVCFELLARRTTISKLLTFEHELVKVFQNRLPLIQSVSVIGSGGRPARGGRWWTGNLSGRLAQRRFSCDGRGGLRFVCDLREHSV
jgi:hypothetical protein